MNQGRIWCVVNPSVGLPLLLGSVAATSLIVHASVMTHTTWMSSYWSGSWRNRPPVAAAPRLGEATPSAAPAFAVTITPVPGLPGKAGTSFVVAVTPNPDAAPVEAAVDDQVPRAPSPVALAAQAAE